MMTETVECGPERRRVDPAHVHIARDTHRFLLLPDVACGSTRRLHLSDGVCP